MAERIYRARLEGRRIELRRGDLGAETLLVDGREVSRHLVKLSARGHHVDVQDERGATRHLEVRLVDESRLGIGRYVALVSIDGVPRARVQPVPRPHDPVRACLHCGYILDGLPVLHDEIRCPECGRHTPEMMIGRQGGAGGGGEVNRTPADDAQSPAGSSGNPPSAAVDRT